MRYLTQRKWTNIGEGSRTRGFPAFSRLWFARKEAELWKKLRKTYQERRPRLTDEGQILPWQRRTI